ncbi:MAG: tRNA (guanosine(46)-N7)-methyltransferase TrmB [Bacteroidetes bacterium GWE2_29_8]|nr:MAG: tRNA (guanosine(46)-N7)-methyltransferase TrmB [Bacteroidetes bacterium GWE2_29_8]OFY14441.1 MAG: tRNA (guanosine(46)-N7)-methyltransferase TrmB [Bacteroidetes bacterium GWF2_29_10]
MAKRKLQRFAEIDTFTNVLQPTYKELLDGLPIKGRWNKDFFQNDNPIVLELGCGKGEYAIGLGKEYPNVNYIGIDYKGSRLWLGAKIANVDGLNNIAFIRSRVDQVEHCFGSNEVDEIWITFPDPQEQDSRMRKRLTHPLFLDRYSKILKKGGSLNLKTDNDIFFEYSLEILRTLNHNIVFYTRDLYNESVNDKVDLDKIRGIKTYYENKFLQENKTIKYLVAKLN